MSVIKFHTGDVVRVCKHWSNTPELAVVMGCYRDLHTGSDEKSYAVEFPDDRQAWFQSHQFELLESCETGKGMRLLKAWRKAKYERQDAEEREHRGGGV